MFKATYVGSAHPELVGKTALARVTPGNPHTILAQFDDIALLSPTLKETRPDLVEGVHGGPLLWGFGWHEIPIEDMRIDATLDDFVAQEGSR